MNKNVLFISSVFILVNFFNSAIGAVEPERGNITMRVVVANPSKDKVQKVPAKVYLPKEVGPNDIINSGVLEVKYDTERSVYYVYSDGIELQPGEIRAFDIELKDVWIVPQEKLDNLKAQTDSVLSGFENTEYYENAKKLADAIYKTVDAIKITQNSEVASRKKHMSIYRNNIKLINQIEGDIAILEKQLTIINTPPEPEVSGDAKVETDLQE